MINRYGQRMWVNQPSTAQPYHKYHGTNVIAIPDSGMDVATVFFLSGDVVSLRMGTHALSPGWLKPKEQPAPPLDLDNPPERLVTNNGQSARILGKLTNPLKVSYYPYVIAVEDPGSNTESVYYANRSGRIDRGHNYEVQQLQAPQPVKREGWVNVYEPTAPNRFGITHDSAGAIFESKQAAKDFGADRIILDTVKITWEE